MMLTLGLFVFMLQTLPYQSMNRNAEYRWPSNARVGLRPATQFLGMDEEKITLSGVLLPEITGGRWSLLTLQLMAEQGRAWPLIEGTGTIYFADGSPRRTEFTLNLKRVDESLSAMFGDLRQQAGELYDKAGEMAGKAAGAMGGLLS